METPALGEPHGVSTHRSRTRPKHRHGGSRPVAAAPRTCVFFFASSDSLRNSALCGSFHSTPGGSACTTVHVSIAVRSRDAPSSIPPSSCPMCGERPVSYSLLQPRPAISSGKKGLPTVGPCNVPGGTELSERVLATGCNFAANHALGQAFPGACLLEGFHRSPPAELTTWSIQKTVACKATGECFPHPSSSVGQTLPRDPPLPGPLPPRRETAAPGTLRATTARAAGVATPPPPGLA